MEGDGKIWDMFRVQKKGPGDISDPVSAHHNVGHIWVNSWGSFQILLKKIYLLSNVFKTVLLTFSNPADAKSYQNYIK